MGVSAQLMHTYDDTNMYTYDVNHVRYDIEVYGFGYFACLA
jgi:hypothetical protein